MSKAEEQENKSNPETPRKPRVAPEERSESRPSPEGVAGKRDRTATSGVSPETSRPRTPGLAAVSRKLHYMISARNVPGIAPVSADTLEQNLRNMPDCEVMEVLEPRGTGAVGGGIAGSQRVVVVRMPEERAEALRRTTGHQLVVERDHPLTFFPELAPVYSDPGIAVRPTDELTLRFRVLANDAPVADAEVYVFGSLWPAQGLTDEDGRVEITAAGESEDTIRAVYVRPDSDQWNLVMTQPAVDPEGENVINLLSLNESVPNFPQKQLVGWGQRIMRLDQLPPNFRGQGVKVAIIDTGVAASHDALRRQAKRGIDAITGESDGWKEDLAGHGTHCAGVIAAESENGTGIRGCAPEAEIISCKVFPGGRFSHVVDAIDYCIEQQADIIVLTAGGREPSLLLEEKIFSARQLGIACIVAAGDSGGPVQYPATSPNVLTVGAIGKIGEFPPNSYHAATFSGRVDAQGCFSPVFSCYGPQVAVSAPGVAVISTVPPNNYGALDGTSVAACHVAGLAALLLAHHPEFQSQGAMNVRTPQRVDRLFQLIWQSAVPVDVGDASRTGAGVPDATRAFAIGAAIGVPGHMLGSVPGVLPGVAGLGTVPAGAIPMTAFGATAFAGQPGGGFAWPPRFVAQASQTISNAATPGVGVGGPASNIVEHIWTLRAAGLL